MFSIVDVLIIVLAYLLGSISFSYLFARFLKNVDIREHGSGNAGATNTMRLLGKGPAFFVLILDALKGAGAVGIGFGFSEQVEVVLLCGLAAVIGHNWPIFLHFRGGKGIATTIGVTAVLFLQAALLSGAFSILVILFTRFVSVGSLLYTTSLPIILLFLPQYATSYIWFSIILAVLALYRHHENIRRLIKGEEHKIKWRGEDK